MLENRTSYFYSQIFPKLETIVNTPKKNYPMNSIDFRNIVLFGTPASGKTETARAIVEEAVKIYGKENVNATKCKSGELQGLLELGLNKKLIQILFADDIMLEKPDRYLMARFFSIRHTWLELTKRNYGLIVGILATHRFHNIFTALRTVFDALICREAPDNKYDRISIENYIGKEAVKYLEGMKRKRRKNKELMRYSVFYSDHQVGILDTPLAECNYLDDLTYPIWWRP